MTALLADVGGTNARFAFLQADGRPGPATVLPTSAYPDFGAAVRDWRARQARSAVLTGAAVCAAGPVTEAGIRLTNYPWEISFEIVRSALGVGEPVLLNDFTAVALGLPALGENDVRKVGEGRTVSGSPIAVLGPGTGLGVSALVPTGSEELVALEGEGGHVSLAPASRREAEVIECLTTRHGHASAERAVSGPGLVEVYRALCDLDGQPPEDWSPAAVAGAAWERSCARAVEAVGLFTAWLGSVAGDLALTLGARGGVYIAGGIVPDWGPRFDDALFRRRFTAKGRFAGYLAEIPTWVIMDPYPALKGLARVLLPQRPPPGLTELDSSA